MMFYPGKSAHYVWNLAHHHTDIFRSRQDKYRPATLKQVVGQDETLSVLKTFMIHRVWTSYYC